MYLALAHTVAGFFAPMTTSIEIFSAKIPDQASEIAINKPQMTNKFQWPKFKIPNIV
jgi:hypothetical protein